MTVFSVGLFLCTSPSPSGELRARPGASLLPQQSRRVFHAGANLRMVAMQRRRKGPECVGEKWLRLARTEVVRFRVSRPALRLTNAHQVVQRNRHLRGPAAPA
jgi:hypothetical protein